MNSKMECAETAPDLAREVLKKGLVSGVLSAPRRTGNQTQTAQKIRIRKITQGTEEVFHLEYFQGKQVFHRNKTGPELDAFITESLGTVYAKASFSVQNGETIQALSNKRGRLSVLRKNNPDTAGAVHLSAGQTHDRKKKYILEEGVPVPFLMDLGIMNSSGTVLKAKYDKFRQINRFLEFIEDIVPELRRHLSEEKKTLSIIDFGCGKSYLTFAVYYYLAVLQKLPVHITGLDLKKDVIQKCGTLAQKYGYDGLSFIAGDIAGYAENDSPDMVISLHACDTATDEALAQAVRKNAKIIFSVPCCQHEINGQLSKQNNDSASQPGRFILAPLLRHGIVREQFSSLLTDALRASLLEKAGYTVQVMEFIDMVHTPKNLLIRAVFSETRENTNQNTEYETLRDFMGVHPALEGLLS
ncbi:SAM-dependent methyltransferase [Brucepastera parasyntrophica]|uniref:class I SAM-dependent methyltransferase n=1 Tax=Brucepastera parasyntrophica TaxID=2880008 RepID=UPI00210D6A0A|nr:SAM-dependent methyltransferase [Brucepastera parasyntrophica]ULQ58497.1 SAM-dependent methyltransferase [Brucepastera parasyntrophica]